MRISILAFFALAISIGSVSSCERTISEHDVDEEFDRLFDVVSRGGNCAIKKNPRISPDQELSARRACTASNYAQVLQKNLDDRHFRSYRCVHDALVTEITITIFLENSNPPRYYECTRAIAKVSDDHPNGELAKPWPPRP